MNVCVCVNERESVCEWNIGSVIVSLCALLLYPNLRKIAKHTYHNKMSDKIPTLNLPTKV